MSHSQLVRLEGKHTTQNAHYAMVMVPILKVLGGIETFLHFHVQDTSLDQIAQCAFQKLFRREKKN